MKVTKITKEKAVFVGVEKYFRVLRKRHDVIDEALALAMREMLQWSSDYEIIEQSGEAYCDIRQMKYYYRVKTTYAIGSGEIGCFFTYYEVCDVS